MPHIVSQQGRWVNVFIKVDDATTHHFLVREAHFDDDMITLKLSQDESDDDPVFRSYFRERYIGYGSVPTLRTPSRHGNETSSGRTKGGRGKGGS